MALIKCPECGRAGVSDHPTAKGCPGCGINVYKYLEREKYIKRRKQEEIWKKEGKCPNCGSDNLANVEDSYKSRCKKCNNIFMTEKDYEILGKIVERRRKEDIVRRESMRHDYDRWHEERMEMQREMYD